MWRPTLVLSAAFSTAAALAPVFAQAPGMPVAPELGNTVLIARYQCNPAELGKVDQVLKEVSAPVLNRMVSEGKLISWGVLATYIGGPENRTIYLWAKDPVALMKARAEYLPEIMAKPGWNEMARVCPVVETSINNLNLKSQSATK